MMFVVLGNFSAGFNIVGPFETFDEADAWFDEAGGMGTLYLITPLDPKKTLIDRDKCACDAEEVASA